MHKLITYFSSSLFLEEKIEIHTVNQLAVIMLKTKINAIDLQAQSPFVNEANIYSFATF